MDSLPSSFLEAIPRELLDTRKTARLSAQGGSRFGFAGPAFSRRRERLGLSPGVAQPTGRYVDYSDSQEPVRLVKGARVRHPQFGGGTVLELSGYGSDLRAAIHFDSVGRKQVVVRYANLQPDWD